MKRQIVGLIIAIFFIISIIAPVFAQTVDQLQKTGKELEKEEELRQRIEKKEEKPTVEEELPKAQAPAVPAGPEQKVLIKTITVTGVTFLPEKEINAIVLPNKNKELSLKDIQKMADLITDAYRKKGYVTSRAYLPPQKIQEGALEIRVIEGTMGDLDVKGNKYFKTAIYKKKIALKKGGAFDYNMLARGLSKINEKADRNAKAVLMPGKEAGATDVLLEAKDRLPIHPGFTYSNYASRYVERNLYRTNVVHNNITGHDDILNLVYGIAKGENYRLTSIRYLLPITDRLEIGVSGYKTKLDLQREYEDINARGKARIFNFYATQTLVKSEKTLINANLGFDYKDVFNFQLGDETSRDRMRVAKAGVDVDLTDRLGRTLMMYEFDYGIPDFMGGLNDVDAKSSRAGAGGKFVKNDLSLVRLHRMPFNSSLLMKSQMMISPDILTASEQFQIGGISNVRGYPAAEAVGDKGYSATLEWAFPPYFLPRNMKVPFSKAKFYDALKFAPFYDWGNVHLKSPQPNEEKSKTLRAAGCGVRLTLPEKFTVKVDCAWSLDNKPSDGDHFHAWTEVSKSF